MTEDNKTVVAAVAAPTQEKKKKKYKKREPIYDASFSFTDSNMSRAKIKSDRKKERRSDTGVKGLFVYLRDSGSKTFYAGKKVPMFNKEQNTWEKNTIYKKMFQWSKNTGFDCVAARDKVALYLEKISDSRSVSEEEITIEDMAKKYAGTGIDGFRIGGNDTLEYKSGVKAHYRSIINSYILLTGCTDRLKEKLVAPIEYGGRVYTKPLKDYKAKELTTEDLDAFKWRMKDTKQVCNNVLALLSVIYTWSRIHKFYTGDNPCLEVRKFPKNAHRIRLPENKKQQILDYCEGKAHDYNPHFLTLVAMGLYTGCRGLEMYGMRWKEPTTEAEKESCSGWLEPDWENLDEKRHIVLWNTKNRKEFRPFLRRPLKKLLIKLRSKMYNDPNFSWCLESDFIFPKTRFKQKFPKEHTDAHALVYPLNSLNEKFGLQIEVNGKLRNIYTMKIGRKEFVSQVAEEQGVEVASRSVNHRDTKVTREHYLVPDKEELEFEFKERPVNVENIEKHRIEKRKKVK
jgi:integrase